MADERIRYLLTAQDQTRGAFSSFEASLKRTQNAISQIRATGFAFFGAAALGEIRDAAGALIDARVQAEKLGNTLAQAVGSGGVRAELGFIREQAQRLGLEFNSTAQSYAKFAAASRGTSLEGSQTRDIFLGIAQASTALGLSSEETAGALTAVQQIISKGKVSAEELRGQLGERLPGAFQIAARSIGVTTQQLDAMLVSGSLLADDFLPKFAKQLRQEFADSAEAASKSTQASLNRIQTAWNQLKETTAKGPIGDAAATGLKSAADEMQRFADNTRGASKESKSFLETLIALLPFTGTLGRIAGALADQNIPRGLQTEQIENAYSTFRSDTQRQFPPRGTASQIRGVDNPQIAALNTQANADLRKLLDQFRTPAEKIADEIAELRRLGGLTGTDVSGAIAEVQRRGPKDEISELILKSTEQERDRIATLRENILSLIDPYEEFRRKLQEIDDLQKLGPENGGINKDQAAQARFEVQNQIQDLSDKSVPERTKKINDATKSLEDWVKQQKLEIATMNEADTYRETAIKLRELEIAGITEGSAAYEAFRDQIIGVARAREIAKIDAETDSGKLEKTQRTLNLLVAEFEETWGRIGSAAEPEKLEEAQRRLAERMNVVLKTAEKIPDALRPPDDLFAPLTSSLEDMIFKLKSGSDIAKALAQDVAKVFLRSQFTGPAAQALAQGATGLFGGQTLFESLFGITLQKRAGGGSFMTGQPYLVGERGPELVVPRRDGTVIPNGQFGGGPSFTWNVSVAPGATKQDLDNAMRAMKAQTQAEILHSMNNGGAFARAGAG